MLTEMKKQLQEVEDAWVALRTLLQKLPAAWRKDAMDALMIDIRASTDKPVEVIVKNPAANASPSTIQSCAPSERGNA